MAGKPKKPRTVRKPTPKPTWQSTAEWRAEVRARMDKLGLNGTSLGALVGVSHATISYLLNEDLDAVSEHIPAINRALKMEPPVQLPLVTPQRAAVLSMILHWDNETVEKILPALELIGKKGE